jgi:Holliday junction resolvase
MPAKRPTRARGLGVSTEERGPNHKARGTQRERAIVKLLRDDGWVAFRAPASLGVADVIAMRANQRLGPGHGAEARLIEVKSTSTRGPYNDFGPAQRYALREAARQAGAEAWLAWWPMRGELQWIEAELWPDAAYPAA